MLKINVTKQRDDFLLNIDLEIKPSFTALFGPSGSGKTTTLNLISGLLKPTEGEIRLSDRVLFSSSKQINLRPQDRQIGYIFQESRLFPHLSVKKNLEFGYKILVPNQRRFAFERIIDAIEIGALLERNPEELSGGEKQRVALARALLASPDYLLMDEPLAALDIPTRLAFLQFLKTIHHELDLPILYVSHDLSNVLNFADQVVILNNGTVVGYGTPYSLLEKMSTQPISQDEISNIFEATLKDDIEKGLIRASTGNLDFVLPHFDYDAEKTVLLNIPASEIILSTEEPHGLSASNIFKGKINEIHQLGERILLKVAAGEMFTVEIIPATVERLALSEGKKVYLIIKATSFKKL